MTDRELEIQMLRLAKQTLDALGEIDISHLSAYDNNGKHNEHHWALILMYNDLTYGCAQVLARRAVSDYEHN